MVFYVILIGLIDERKGRIKRKLEKKMRKKEKRDY